MTETLSLFISFMMGGKKVLTLEASLVRTSLFGVADDGLHLGITDLCLWSQNMNGLLLQWAQQHAGCVTGY